MAGNLMVVKRHDVNLSHSGAENTPTPKTQKSWLGG